MFSGNDGRSWQSLQLNLPTVAVHDLIVKDDNLVLATHGRSVWILDDLQPVRELTESVAAEPTHLFPVADAVRWHYGAGNYGGRIGAFDSAPHGASIYYSLKDKTANEIRIEILDAQQRVVRTLSSVVKKPDNSSDNEDPEDLKKAALQTDAGVQRAVWDLRYEGASKIKDAKIDRRSVRRSRASPREPTPCASRSTARARPCRSTSSRIRAATFRRRISRRRPRSPFACATMCRS